jgi:predicted short-subunit dehydrogenase-like oxidoreductase (DUF2520 family)
VCAHRISFAGAGNVSAALSRALKSKGSIIEHFVSRNSQKGLSIAESMNATWSADYVFPDSSGLIIVAVPDHAIEKTLRDIKCNENAVVVHTAGSVGIDVFKGYKHYGIIYPLQTFSQGRNPDFSSVPILTEASDQTTHHLINEISKTISNKVFECDSEKRRMLHLAAVFASNFTNHVLTQGKMIAGRVGFSFDVLEPLLRETIDKALTSGPENSQTGPAFRNDLNTVKKHLEILSFSPELKDIYEIMSNSIMEYYKHYDD